MEALVRDLRTALRRMGRSPGFVLAAVVSLGLGIGANTTIFSLLNALALRPLPVSEPERLVRLGSLDSRGFISEIPGPLFDWLRHDPLFDGVCGVSTPLTTVEFRKGSPLPAGGLALLGGCYEMLGVRPALGRLFTRRDDVPNGPRVVVLGYDFWQRQFGGEAGVPGQSIDIDGAPFTIIGVTERRFQGFLLGYPPAVMLPITQVVNPSRGAPGFHVFYRGFAFARLKRGVTAEEAQAHLRVDWRRQLDAALPAGVRGSERTAELNEPLVVTSGSTGLDYTLRNRFRRPLVALLAISALVLLVACINVANLLLARGLEQRREIAVRLALGARRWQIVRELLVESAVLMAAGIGCALLLARLGDRVLLAVLSRSYSGFALTANPDARVWLFTAAAALVALLLFGLLPAHQTSAPNLTDALKSGSRSHTPGHTRVRRVLICGQVALTLVLVMGAGVFLETLRHLREESLGFETERVLNVQLMPVPGGYAHGFSQGIYYRSLLDRMQRLPGVEAASLSHFSPLFTNAYPQEVRPALSPDAPPIQAPTEYVSDGFLSALRIPLLEGRDFQRSDLPQTPKTVMVSESLAKRLFPNGTALGQHIRVGSDNATQDLEIIGIAADARLEDPRARDSGFVYLNSWQRPDYQQWGDLQLRYRGNLPALATAVRRELQKAGHEYPLFVRTMADQRDNALLRENLLATLGTAFAVVTLTLAGVGLFGLLNLLVTHRGNEIAIRVALGASQGNVRGMVIREALAMVGVGLIMGLPVALVGVRVLTGLLYGVGAWPLETLAAAVGLLAGVAGLAALIPARRATAIDPMIALRHE